MTENTESFNMEQEVRSLQPETARCICCGKAVVTARKFGCVFENYVFDCACVCRACAVLLPLVLLHVAPFSTFADMVTMWRDLVKRAESGGANDHLDELLNKRGCRR